VRRIEPTPHRSCWHSLVSDALTIPSHVASMYFGLGSHTGGDQKTTKMERAFLRNKLLCLLEWRPLDRRKRSCLCLRLRAFTATFHYSDTMLRVKLKTRISN
jgi:hypothetical protein